MAVLGDKKVVAAPFGNEAKLVTISYDFAVDGGAVADYDVLEADGNLLVEFFNADVETALTCDTDFDIDLGKGAGGVDFWSDLAKASFALDAQVASANVGRFVELADGEKIIMGIETAAATAGKMHLMFRCYKRP